MRTVFITGTNRGIGLEFVRQYLDRGERVIASCRNLEAATELQALSASNSNLTIIEHDVSDPESIERTAALLGDAPIDIFINNAGVYGSKNVQFGNVTQEQWLDVLNVNTVAPLLLTQVIIENLRKGNDKKLIYITSKMGSIEDNGGGGAYIYRSSKTALNQVVKSIAVDLGKEGFTAAVVHPGWVQTDMGGPNALIDTKTSVGGMIAVIDQMQLAQSGGFYNYDGATIPW
jgi:NAD(P)-dependent dehydrogenase (short-subunit alcohol dehydrogenase family)